MSDTCKSCGAPIVWARNSKTENPMPLDEEPSARGNVNIERDLFGDLVAVVVAPGAGTHVSHFATCPDAAGWRQSGGKT